jgi:lipid A 3-O-deacylase
MGPSTFLRRARIALLVLAATALGGPVAEAQSASERNGFAILGSGPSYLDLAAGAFDIPIHHGAVTTAEGRVEFRFGEKLFDIGPAAGLLVNAKGGVYGYGGFYGDFAFGRFVVTPLAAVGAYSRGSGPDLGGTFEFRLSINAAYEFDNQSRVGLQIAHISNAGIHRRNPDDNELLVTYGFPLHLPF